MYITDLSCACHMPQPCYPSVIICIIFGENTDCEVTFNVEVFSHLTRASATHILPSVLFPNIIRHAYKHIHTCRLIDYCFNKYVCHRIIVRKEMICGCDVSNFVFGYDILYLTGRSLTCYFQVKVLSLSHPCTFIRSLAGFYSCGRRNETGNALINFAGKIQRMCMLRSLYQILMYVNLLALELFF